MGGSSKKQTVGYKYYVGEHMILCHGPVDKLTIIRVDDRTLTKGAFEAGKIVVNKPDLFGGPKREGGISGEIDLEFGGSSQGQNDYLQSRLGSVIPAFRGVVGVVLRQLYLGMNPYLKPWSFRLSRIFVRQAGIPQWYLEKAAVRRIGDSADVVYSEYEETVLINEMNLDGETNCAPDGNFSPLIGQDIKGLSTSDEIVVTEVDGTPLYKAWSKWGEDYLAPDGNAWTNAVLVTDDTLSEGGTQTFNSGTFASDTQALQNKQGFKLKGSTEYYFWLRDGGQKNDNRGGTSYKVVKRSLIEKLEAHDDMNPAHIIRECLTDPDWGMGYQDADIDDVSFMNAADTLFDEKMGMSLLWSRQDTIEEFVQEVTKHIDAALYVDRRTGLFTLKLVRDDYEEASLPVFDESNISKIQNLQKASFGELVNSVTVNYWDAATGKTASLTVQDTALVQMQNAVINTTIQYPGFTSPEVASIAAMRDLKALSSPLWSGTIYCGQDAEDLNIGDVFKLSWSDYEIENVVMRITGLAFGNGKSKTVKVICTQDVYATPNESTIKAPDIEDGWQPLDNTPTPLNSTLIQEIPYYELVTRLGQTEIDEKLAEDANLSYMIASGSRPNSEGALNALLFVNSGSAYEEQDTLDFSPSAKIANDVLPTQTTFVIENGVDLDVVSIGTFCQLGEELLRVDEISETTLTVGRGILDTVPTPHLAGSEILFLDEFLASDEIEYTASESIDVKLLTVTGGGVLDIEDAVEDSLTFDSRPIRPYPPGNFKINTVPFGNVIDNLNDLTIAWSHRDRTLQTSGEFEDQTTGNIGPEVGTTYNLRIYGEADTLGREETLISGTSYLYELATEKTDFLIPNESAGSGPATSVDITDLKAFWTFDESTGTDVLDVHTTAINGTLTSTALRDSEGFMNTCLKADSSNYVSLGSASNLLGLVDTFEYVAAVWIPSAGDSFYMLDLGYRGFSSDGQCEGLLFYVNSGNLAFRVKTADADFGNALRGRWDTGLALKPGEWNLVFCSRTPTEASGHVFNSDGNFSATLDLGGTFGLVWADFGNWMLGIANGSGSPNAGTTPGAKLDYQGVFARTLSAAERVSMWNGGNGFLYPFEASGGEYRANGRLRIELESERDGFKSFNKYSHEILREGYGFNYGKLYGGV